MALVVDFDGTITTKDTIGELAAYAILIQRHLDQGNPEPAWKAIVQAYEDEYREYASWYTPQESERTSMAQEVDFLRGLGEVDARSRRRVEDLRLFAGIGGTPLRASDCPFTRKSPRPVGIRRGFKEFVAAAKENGLKVVVVSVNWSTAFIRCAVEDPDVEVVANEITADGKIVGPGGIPGLDGVMSTSHHKKVAMDAVTTGHPTAPSSPLVYVGDSLTDLECLAGARRGVVIAQEEGETSLLRALKRVGVKVAPVGDSGAGDEAQYAGMYWARDFCEIQDSGLVDRLLLRWKRGQMEPPSQPDSD